MRISDWSSDVCSSDLCQPLSSTLRASASNSSWPMLGVPRHERIIEAPPRRPQQRHPDQLALQEEFEERRLASKRPLQRQDTVPPLLFGAAPLKIVRASERERCCHNV